MAQSNLRKWWKQIKLLASQNCNQEWYHQFLGAEFKDTLALANGINDFFVSITEQFVPLTPVEAQHTTIPQELLVSQREVLADLSKLATNKAIEQDGISNRILKEFAPEVTPVIQDIYNQSVREGYVPDSLKQSFVCPVPKISPPQDIHSDLRPISLTSCLAKVMEGFTHRRVLNQVDQDIDPRQFARKGHSTTHALIYLLQAIYEAVDNGNNSARIFFTDFSKGFDLIDHN